MTFLPEAPALPSPYPQWATLREKLVPFVGERAVNLFAHAIASHSKSSVTAEYFRGLLADAGDDPSNPQVTETEQLLIDWGKLIAEDPSGIGTDFYARLEGAFTPYLRELLVAFAGQMVATTVYIAVGRIPLDAPSAR
jgi:hypothetical protein